MQNKLLKKFIYIATGGFNFNILLNFNTKVPLIAIWEESEDPTDEEIEVIYSRILKGAASIYYPHVIEQQKYTDEGHNTVTLKKEGGLWTFRRLTWSQGPMWSQKTGTIEEIAEELYPTKKENPVQVKAGAVSHTNTGFDTTSLGTE